MQVRVNGPDTAPVYKFLKANKSGFLGSRIKWNFTKFLVDKEGNVLRRYGSTTSPFSIEVQSLSISLHGAYVRLCSFHLDFDVSALNNDESCHLRLICQDTNGVRQPHMALWGYAIISCVNECGYCYVTRGLACKCEERWYMLLLKLEIILICCFPVAFTEWHQDSIGGGLKDSTITSNWCSCWRWLKHKECIFVDVSSSDYFLHISCLGFFVFVVLEFCFVCDFSRYLKIN